MALASDGWSRGPNLADRGKGWPAPERLPASRSRHPPSRRSPASSVQSRSSSAAVNGFTAARALRGSDAVMATQNGAHTVSMVDARSMLFTTILGLGFFHVDIKSHKVALYYLAASLAPSQAIFPLVGAFENEYFHQSVTSLALTIGMVSEAPSAYRTV